MAEAWAEAGIQNLQVKSVPGLSPAFPYRSDNLDVLVPLERGPAAADIMLDMGYVELKNVEEPHKFLFRKFVLGKEVSAIHMHEWAGWGTGFLDTDNLWKFSRQSPDDPVVNFPSSTDGLLITMAHAFYENKTVIMTDVQKVRHCLHQPDLDWDRAIDTATRMGWKDGLGVCLQIWSHVEGVLFGHSLVPEQILAETHTWPSRALQNKIDELKRLHGYPFHVPFWLSKRFFYGKMWRDKTIGLRRKFWEALLHTTAGIRRNIKVDSHAVMLVTVSGLDGAGKTAHVKKLSEAFTGCHIKNEIVWARGGSTPVTDAVLRLVRGFRSGKDEQSGGADGPLAKVERRRAQLRTAFARQGWTAVVGFDLLIRYLQDVWWPMRRGRVVICDRFLYDALVEVAAYAEDAGLPGSLLARFMIWLAPKPTVRWLLDISPETAAQRSAIPESTDFLAQQCDLFRLGVNRWGLQVVDNEADFVTISDELVRATLRRYYRDYKTVINALFIFNPRREMLACKLREQPKGNPGPSAFRGKSLTGASTAKSTESKE
ncbi:MAG: nucleotidyltransferase family protein [bacterium]